jgi:hypothetical protein
VTGKFEKATKSYYELTTSQVKGLTLYLFTFCASNLGRSIVEHSKKKMLVRLYSDNDLTDSGILALAFTWLSGWVCAVMQA